MDLRQELDDLISGRGRVAAGERLRRLFDITWRHRLAESPEYATYTGAHGFNHLWSDSSLDAIERRKGELDLQKQALDSIAASQLTAEDALNHELFSINLDNALEGRQFRSELLPLAQATGPQSTIPNILGLMPTFTVAQYEDIISRIRGVPQVIDQTIALLDAGAQARIVAPRITLKDVPGQIESLAEALADGPLLRAFREFPASFADRERTQLTKEAQAAVAEKAVPAFRRFYEYVTDSYLPLSRQTIAMSDLPDGSGWYAFRVRTYTTTNLTPGEIHHMGQSEVSRIKSEMHQVMKQSGFSGSFAEFTEYLRTDPKFFFTSAEELLVAYRDISKRADPELAKLFGRLPRLPYGVIPIPEYSAPFATTAYYQPGSLEAGRAGYFFANTYSLSSRPRWEMEALSLHEAVPGHHLQIALAQELGDLPEFRRHAQYTAFIEGWGLYAESLGDEMGFYADAYSRFGKLTYEIWRAIRLVVDTGMHALGWTRDEAIDFFKANTGKAEHDILVEIDRYISWPGQALAYKIGEMKIKQLRAAAEERLGSTFNIREFHDMLIGNGALPLDVCERLMTQWLAHKAS